MRHILRSQSPLLQLMTKNKQAFAKQSGQRRKIESIPINLEDLGLFTQQQKNKDQKSNNYKQISTSKSKHERQTTELEWFQQQYLDEKNLPFRIQGEWELAAPHLFVPDYDLLNPPKGEQIAKTQLGKYNQALNLTIEKDLFPKLFHEQTFYRRKAKYHLSEMEPLTSSFINQGYNFLDKKLLMHLIEKQDIKTLKQLLTLGAFQEADFIDDEVLTDVIVQYQISKRNLFLVNLLPFEAELVSGTKPPVMRHNIGEQIKFRLQEPTFTLILYNSHHSGEVNKLRLLWSYQRYYLYKFSFSEFVIPELKKMQFKVSDPQLQALLNKEVNYILTNAFPYEALVTLYYNLIETTKTYHNFVKSWVLAVILYSKLRSIPKVVNRSCRNELNPIFQLIQFNLPKEVSDALIQNVYADVFFHEDSNHIWSDNYYRCLEHWMQDFTQPQTTKYNSVLSKLLEGEETITVVFQHQEKVEPYARTVINLNKNRETKTKGKPKSQKDMIFDLLHGNYQSVFQHFMMRYSFASDFDMAAKFYKQLKKVDKQFKFRTKHEECLYKLKVANNFFLTEGISKPLNRQSFKMYKENIQVASLIDRGLLDGDQINQPAVQEQLEKEERALLNSAIREIPLKLGKLTQKRDFMENFGSKIEQESNQMQEESSEDGLLMFNSDQKKHLFLGVQVEEPFRPMLADILNDLESNNIIDKKSLADLEKLPIYKSREKFAEIIAKYEDFINKEIAQQMAASKDISILEEIETILEQQPEHNRDELIESETESLVAAYQLTVDPGEEDEQLIDQMAESLEQNDENHNDFNKPLQNKKLFDSKKPLKLELQKQQFNLEKPGDAEYAEVQRLMMQPSMEEIQNEFFQETEQSTEIDGARYDRDLLNSVRIRSMYSPEQQKQLLKQYKAAFDYQFEQRQQEERQRALSKEEQFQLFVQINQTMSLLQNTPDYSIFDREIYQNYALSLMALSKGKDLQQQSSTSQNFSQDSSEDEFQERNRNQNRGGEYNNSRKRSQNRRYLEKETKANQSTSKRQNFSRKNKYSFCTAQPVEPSRQLATQYLFDLEKIQEYRGKEVQKHFFEIMKSETHIPKVGSGLAVAKYLFLHSKLQKKMVIDPKKKMSIEFTSVVGTRTKNYESFLRNTLYNYQLEDNFYEELLSDQLSNYNRYEFKQIVAHMIYFKSAFTNRMVDLICSICQQHQTGFTFVEIAQFMNANQIVVSVESLEKITSTWHRFRLINEDMLGFVREYCKNVNMQFKTSFYSHLCASLIKIKDFDKLKDLCSAVLTEIKPKSFKIDSNTKASDVPALEKAWKAQQQEKYIRLYLELIEVIVINLSNQVPEYLFELFTEYRKLVPSLGEKELGYGLVCSCLNKSEFIQLLGLLEKSPQYGSEFMYDCLMQSLLSNFDELQEYSERMLDCSVFINRLVLNNDRIMRALLVFKKSSTSNSFSKFLEHCLRFQPEVTTNPEIKKEMFYILNNNVQDVSVGGVFNLLDFIFNEKREEERLEYRKIKLSEEEKERKLAEIQEAKNVEQVAPKTQKSKKKVDPQKEQAAKPEQSKSPAEASVKESQAVKQKQSKKDLKQEKKQQQKEAAKGKQMIDQKISEAEARSPEDVKELEKSGMSDDDIISSVKNQGLKHVSAKRGGIKTFGLLYRSSIQMMQAEEEASKQAEKSAAKGKSKKK